MLLRTIGEKAVLGFFSVMVLALLAAPSVLGQASRPAPPAAPIPASGRYVIPCGASAGVYSGTFQVPSAPARFRVTANVQGYGRFIAQPTPQDEWTTFEQYATSVVLPMEFGNTSNQSGQVGFNVQAQAEPCDVYPSDFVVTNVVVTLLP